MFVKALRTGLGQLIVMGDALSRPRPQQRSAQGQASVNADAASLSLYQFHACPFCIKTRRAIHKLNVPVALRDAKNDGQARQQLLEGGGKVKVPCLRIEEAGGTRVRYKAIHHAVIWGSKKRYFSSDRSQKRSGKTPRTPKGIYLHDY
jgi:glutaredoxin